MPSLPPFGRELPDRALRTLEQWRQTLGPLPGYIENQLSPEGAFTARRGTLYFQTDNSQLYVKITPDGPTGWKPLIVDLDQLRRPTTGNIAADSLGVAGDASIGGTLRVAGASRFASINVSGTSALGEISATLNVTGATTLTTLATMGDAAIGGNLTIAGAFTPTSLTITGNASIGGTLGVGGLTTLDALSVGGALGVTGATTLSSTLAVAGAANLSALNATRISLTGPLSVTGATTLAALSATNGNFSGTLGIESTAGVDLLDTVAPLRVGPAARQHLELGTQRIQSKADARTAATLQLNAFGGDLSLGNNASRVRAAGTLNVAGLATFSTLSTSGNVAVGGDLSVTGAVSSARLALTGNATIGGTLGVTGASTLAALSATTGTFSGAISTENTAGVDLLDAVAPLRVGPAARQHLELGNQRIQSKADARTAAILQINAFGGDISLGAASSRVRVRGATTLAALSATNVDLSGTLGVTGATTLAALSATTGAFSGTLGVTGATNLSTLSTSGNVAVGGNLSVTGAFTPTSLALSGNATVGGTLSVTGATTLAALSASAGTFSGTLGVTGATTLTSLSASGNVTVGGNLSVTGAFTPTSLALTGNATIGGTLSVTGATTLAALSATTGAFSGTLGVTGATTLSTLTTSGNVAVGGNLSVTGAFAPASLSLTGNATVGGTLRVTGATTLAALAGTTGTFSGSLSTESTAGVDLLDTVAPLRIGPAARQHLELGNQRVQSKADARTAATYQINAFGGDVSLGNRASQIRVSGRTTLAALSATDVDFSGTLGVTGATTLTSATVGGTLGVTGATTLTSVTTSGNVAVGGNLSVTGAFAPASLALTGNATVGGTLGVTGVTTLSGDVNAGRNLAVTSNVTVGGTLTVSGLATFAVSVGSTLGVSGNTTLAALSATTGTFSGALATENTAGVDLIDALAPLRIGPAARQHLELGTQRIQSKAGTTAAATIQINAFGGDVSLGNRSSTVRVSGTQSVTLANANSAFVLGSPLTAHLAADTAALQAKSNATTATALNLNTLGGGVNIGQSLGSAPVTLQGSLTRIQGNTPAALVVRNAGDRAPGLGTAQNVMARFETSTGTQLVLLGFDNQTHFDIFSRNHGGHIRMRGETTAGAVRTLLEADPDSGVTLSHTGSTAAQTADESGTGTTSLKIRNPAGTLVPAGVGQLATVVLSSSTSLPRTAMLGMTRLTSRLRTLTIPNTTAIPNNSYGWLVNQTGRAITIAAGTGISLRSHVRTGSHVMSANSLVFWWKQSRIWYLSGDGLG